MKIIAFSGSNSSTSINSQLIEATVKLGEDIEVIDLRNYEPPMYGIDLENESGMPEVIQELVKKLQSADAFIIATPEHNRLMPAFFKNILDWLSRTGEKPFSGPTIVMSTSNGRAGAAGASAAVSKLISAYLGADVIAEFNLPSFSRSFDSEKKEILDKEKESELVDLLAQLTA